MAMMDSTHGSDKRPTYEEWRRFWFHTNGTPKIRTSSSTARVRFWLARRENVVEDWR